MEVRNPETEGTQDSEMAPHKLNWTNYVSVWSHKITYFDGQFIYTDHEII